MAPYRFPDTTQGHKEYLARIQSGEGFIANCSSGWAQGYKLHAASCTFLNAYKNNNPIDDSIGTGKLWAATLKELEDNARRLQPGKQPDRCSQCLQLELPEEFDTDMKRESPLVVPGGQVESNRSRH